MSEKHKCFHCGRVGQNGARYLFTVNGEAHLVHKPCGEQLMSGAPKEVKVTLVPTDELKREWQEQRNANRVRQFWAVKCPELIEIKKNLEETQEEFLSTPVGPAHQ